MTSSTTQSHWYALISAIGIANDERIQVESNRQRPRSYVMPESLSDVIAKLYLVQRQIRKILEITKQDEVVSAAHMIESLLVELEAQTRENQEWVEHILAALHEAEEEQRNNASAIRALASMVARNDEAWTKIQERGKFAELRGILIEGPEERWDGVIDRYTEENPILAFNLLIDAYCPVDKAAQKGRWHRLIRNTISRDPVGLYCSVLKSCSSGQLEEIGFTRDDWRTLFDRLLEVSPVLAYEIIRERARQIRLEVTSEDYIEVFHRLLRDDVNRALEMIDKGDIGPSTPLNGEDWLRLFQIRREQGMPALLKFIREWMIPVGVAIPGEEIKAILTQDGLTRDDRVLLITKLVPLTEPSTLPLAREDVEPASTRARNM